jgi:pimeloyl-ACP methyl ester carboxylesterase
VGLAGGSNGVRAAAVAAALAGGAVLERRHFRRIASDPQRAFLESPPTGRPLRAHSADGTRLRAEVVGSETLPPLLLAHGWTEALRYWALVIRELTDDFRIVAYDPHASPAVVAFWERMLVSCAPDVRAAVGLALTDMELHRALERLDLPTLVMDGTHDRLTPPSHARRIAASCRDCTA